MKILFVWSGLSGYMGDCWRALAKASGIDLRVSIDTTGTLAGGYFEADDVMHGLDWSDSLPFDWTPDIVFTVGWRNALCRAAALREWGERTRKVCCFDMPWEWRLRKILARFVLRCYLRRFDAAFVPGTLARRYAHWLGFKTERIFKGLFSTDTRRFGAHVGGRGFLYVGRESAEKGLDVLRAAHERYRSEGGTWPLEIVNGVSPDALGPIYAGADCFVLASLYEPWGVVLVEAAAAGLPIICTDMCGARHEVVKGNGIVVPAGDVAALAAAMCKTSRVEPVERVVLGEENHIDGELGRELAKPYSCEAWAKRVLDICGKLVG